MTARDPGLQPERTRLSWRRTVLSVTVVALLAGRLALVGHRTPLTVTAVALAGLLWVFVLVVAQRRVRALDRRVEPGPRSGVALAAAVCGFAVAGALMIFSGVR